MSHRNPRTGRYADDLMAKLHDGTATVGDVIDHAQEIIVEAPETWGTAVSTPVRLLLAIIDRQEAGYEVHQHDLVTPDLLVTPPPE